MLHFAKRSLFAAIALMTSAVAHAEISVVVHPDSPLANMTVEQIAAIYLGERAGFRPIDLPESERLHHWFYYKVTGRDARQIRILRAQLMARAVPPKVASDSTEAVKRVAANKRAIAYVDSRAVDASVKVVLTIQNPALLDELKASD